MSILKIKNQNGEFESVKSIKGEKGDTPVITIGANDNWFVDGVDTGKSSKGDKGDKGDTGDPAPASAVQEAVADYLDEHGVDLSALEGKVGMYDIEGSHLLNYFDKNNYTHVSGKVIYGGGGEGTNASYGYIKFLVPSGKTYSQNLFTNPFTYTVFDKDGTFLEYINPAELSDKRTFTISNHNDELVYLALSAAGMTTFDSTKENTFVVAEGTTIPTDYSEYSADIDWLRITKSQISDYSVTTADLPDEAVTAPKLAYQAVTEMKIKQSLPPYLFDGIGCTNYFDAAYNIANATQWSGSSSYFITPLNYLPAGTYTINGVYWLKTVSLMGVETKVGNDGATGNRTFTLTEETPYFQFMRHCGGNVNNLSGVIVVKGDSLTQTSTERKYTLDNFDTKKIEFTPTHWNGKTYAAIGDSITRGYAPANTDLGIADGSQIENCYAVFTGKQLNMKTYNYGVDGATVRTTLTNNKITAMQNAGITPDVVTVMLGANDAAGITLGTIEDVFTDISSCTFYSGLKEIVRQLQEAFPACTIILIAPPATGARGGTYNDYRLAAKAVAELYNVLFLSFNEGTGFNLNSQASVSYFQLDSIHPNFRAHEIMGKRLTGFIASH